MEQSPERKLNILDAAKVLKPAGQGCAGNHVGVKEDSELAQVEVPLSPRAQHKNLMRDLMSLKLVHYIF